MHKAELNTFNNIKTPRNMQMKHTSNTQNTYTRFIQERKKKKT